jgi:hypothetical protein
VIKRVFGIRCVVVLAIACLMPRPAAAQRETGPYSGLFGSVGGAQTDQADTRQALDIRGSLFGTYNKDSQPNISADGVQDGRLTQTGGAGGVNAAMSYNFRTDKTRFYMNGAGTLQNYYQSGSLSAASFALNTGLTTDLSRRLRMDAQSTTSYSPFYSVFPFNGSSLVSLGAVPAVASAFSPGFAFASAPQRNVYLTDSINVTGDLTRRSSFSLGAIWRESKFLDNSSLSLQTYGGHAEFRHHLTKGLGFHLGYSRDIPRFASGGNSGTAFESIDAGLDYGDTLKFARRWSLSFNTSTAALRLASQPTVGVASSSQTHYRLNGNANLGRGIGRSWTMAVGYARGTEFYAGFQQPLLYDSVNAWLRGQLTRQLQWSSGGLVSRSSIGFGGGSFTQSMASSQLTLALNRSLGLYGQYAYYYSKIPADATVLQWVPTLTRHTGTVGLTMWLPVFNEKRAPRDSR